MGVLVRPLTVVEKSLNYLAALAVIIMMLMVTTDVILSFLFNSPLEGSLEVTEFLMVGIVYGSIAYTQSVKAHIAIDIFVIRLSPRVRAGATTVAWLLMLLFFALLTYRSWAMAMAAWQIREVSMGVTEMPVYPAKTLVPLGSFVICLRLVVDIVKSLRTALGLGEK